jgi:EAL domain-containing protein (putative c-di-GMP-specific phosphodiesterase class I)
VRTIGALRAQGVRVFMDDFGSGSSSLGHLASLEVDGIKIDRGFIAQMGKGDRHLQLVRTVVTLVKTLGFAPIAEGVETDEQLKQLRQMGCAYAQGFLFSKAIPAEQVVKLMKLRVR